MVGHDVILHPCGRLQLLSTVLAGKRLLDITTLNKTYSIINSIKKLNKFSAKAFCLNKYLTSASGYLLRLDAAHLSAVLHMLLQTFNRLSAHTFTLWTANSALGHDLELPALLLTSWESKNQKSFSFSQEERCFHFC